MLNVIGVKDIRRYQELALQSRLRIPLIFGLDVIHGYRTGFPLPLAEAASFDLAMIEEAARYNALESAADGLNWVFAPMVDISWDARWGRLLWFSGSGGACQRLARRRFGRHDDCHGMYETFCRIWCTDSRKGV